jgi:two-component system sensor histidine kinase DesK
MFSTGTNSKQPTRKWAWVWLAYTGFLFVEPIVNPSPRKWFATLAVFAIFLAIYAACVRSFDKGNRTRYWMIGAIFLLGLLTFPWNAGGSTFFIYAAAFLPFSLKSIPRVLVLFVLESAAILIESYIFSTRGHFFYVSWPNAFFAIFLVLIIGGGNIIFAQQRRADVRLHRAQDEIEQLAALAERERIARDLHDVLGHTLSVIVLKAELAGRLLERDPQRAAAEIADVEKTARTALSEVREAIGGYRSQGLPAEMELARSTLHAAGVVLSCETPVPQLRAAEETVLCLAVREAVTNIVRHAQATHCRMRFTTSDDGYHALLIADDGAHPKLQEGNGLRGMRERVKSLGGRLTITADPGVTLLIELPQTVHISSKAPCVAL